MDGSGVAVTISLYKTPSVGFSRRRRRVDFELFLYFLYYGFWRFEGGPPPPPVICQVAVLTAGGTFLDGGRDLIYLPTPFRSVTHGADRATFGNG